ncbi:hypothetical protein [Polyangium fumosum]|uniref:Uncharacterized protein n=1 Tax=Polyangium fumosum TaxID=889272 RepID=A0A4U1IJ87_9BACT|nr:hypothetical protein [Polyangium fumosum]TKC93715.1 hypothetical protein E8A74_49065 [Polyangium fumosum]
MQFCRGPGSMKEASCSVAKNYSKPSSSVEARLTVCNGKTRSVWLGSSALDRRTVCVRKILTHPPKPRLKGFQRTRAGR